MLQIDSLQRRLQSTSQNAQNIQDELDEVRGKSCAEEAAIFDKLQQALRDVWSQQETNKTLSQLIQDMEIKRAAMDKAHGESARRSQTLESDLRRTEQDRGKLLALIQLLEDENSIIHQQLKDANTKEKRHLQLIQDLEQELRYNAKHPPEADRASIIRSDTAVHVWMTFQ